MSLCTFIRELNGSILKEKFAFLPHYFFENIFKIVTLAPGCAAGAQDGDQGIGGAQAEGGDPHRRRRAQDQG
jgi:hypothetical protein